MASVLGKAFFNRPTPDVARDLIGKQLCRRLEKGRIVRAAICETEAYDGFEDRASHAHKGLTPRNFVMFGPPGFTYVYLCYGVHWLLNISTREAGYPAAVLIRGVEGVSGPGRLTRHFQIDRSFNNQRLTRTGDLWIEGPGLSVHPEEISVMPRVGIDYAGPKWSAVPWRFVRAQ